MNGFETIAGSQQRLLTGHEMCITIDHTQTTVQDTYSLVDEVQNEQKHADQQADDDLRHGFSVPLVETKTRLVVSETLADRCPPRICLRAPLAVYVVGAVWLKV